MLNRRTKTRKEKTAKEKKKSKPIEIKLCDFDQVSYRIAVLPDSRDMTVSMSIPCYSDIAGKGAEAAFKASFGEAVTTPTDGYSVSVMYNIEALPEAKREETVTKLKNMRGVVLGGPFKYFYTRLSKGEENEHFKFDLRSDTTVYFAPDKDRVTTIFALDFNERVDKVVARVFLNEFVDARKTIGFAPPVTWGVQPPSELQKWGITENKGGTLGFISFPILKTHVPNEAQIDKIVAVLQTFRNYVQYHIKCSKSYFHSRMRARCGALLKVLNRAKVEDPEKDKTKGKKTISGKTFRRAV